MCRLKGRTRADALLAVDREQRRVERSVMKRAQDKHVLGVFRELGPLTPWQDMREIEQLFLTDASHRTCVVVSLERLRPERLAHRGFGRLVATDSPARIERLAGRPLCDLASFYPALPHVWGITIVVHLRPAV